MLSDDPSDPTVGASKVPLKLQPEFRALGHECDLLFCEGLGRYPVNERLRFAVSPLLAARAAARMWRAHGPYDVLDAVGAEGRWLTRRRFPGAVRIARSHGLDHLFFRELIADHEAGLLRKPWWRRLWYPAARLAPTAAAIRRADRVILLSRREREFVLERGWQPAERIEVVTHGVDAARFEQAPPPDAARGAGVLFSGSWYTGKGIHYLAQAHNLLLSQGLAIPLTILGGGIGHPMPAIERHVRASFGPASQPFLTILPRLSDEDAVFELYRTHDLLVLPSTAEGFGLVVLEAMSQRLPAVISNAVGIADRLCHGREAWIVPARASAALAEAIARLWQDRSLRRALAENAVAWARPYTWRRAAESTLACYAAATGASLAAAAEK